MSQNRLFVGNLSYQTAENELQDYFAQADAVTSVNLMMDKITGRSRGFAFVEFSPPEEAQKAIEQFQNNEFQGCSITGQRRASARRPSSALRWRRTRQRPWRAPRALLINRDENLFNRAKNFIA
jgi:cold-inducible RNA-binding protein